MKKLKLVTLTIFSLVACFGSTIYLEDHEQMKCNVPIHLDKYGTYFRFFHNPDTNKLNSNRYIIVNIDDCKGDLNIKEFISKTNQLVFEGAYKQWKDTIIVIDRPLSPNNITFNKDTFHYYMTLRNGVWKYYSDTGSFILKTEEYHNGKLLK